MKLKWLMTRREGIRNQLRELVDQKKSCSQFCLYVSSKWKVEKGKGFENFEIEKNDLNQLLNPNKTD